jgi:hypothetical protein
LHHALPHCRIGEAAATRGKIVAHVLGIARTGDHDGDGSTSAI